MYIKYHKHFWVCIFTRSSCTLHSFTVGKIYLVDT